MMQIWCDEEHFLQWTIVLVCLVIFSLLAQTYLLPYGVAMLVIWLAVLWWRQKGLPMTTQLSLGLLMGSGVLVVGLLGNLLITQNLPMTLQEIMKWLVGLVVFLSAIRFCPQKKAYPLYWLGLLMVFLVLGLLSLLTWVVPALRILPDMNFLYATFGHNHFSAVLLFIAPWLVLGNRIWPSKIWKWALAGWTVWLFSTFSRLGIVVGAVELLVLALWLRSDKVWHQLLLTWLGVIFCFALAWFGLQMMSKNQSFCAQESYFSQRICKTNAQEQRPEYWRQALESLGEHPGGTGLGTFSAVSLQLRKAPGSYAAHTHNDYLEWTTEAGWWGVFISLCLWGIWWQFRPQVFDWFMRAVWLSTGSLLALGLFDVDLQFVVFLFTVLVGLGWLIGFQQQTVRKTVVRIFWLRMLISLIAFVVVCWAALFLVLNLDWQYGNKQLLAKYGQYYPAHSFLLVTIWPELSSIKKAELLQFWRQDYRVLDYLLDQKSMLFSTAETKKLIQHFYQINPWSRQKHDLVALQFQDNDLKAARETLMSTDVFAGMYQTRFNVTLQSEGDQLRWRQARHYRTLAEKEIEINNGLQAITDIHRAAQFEPWILDDQAKIYCSGLKNWVRRQQNSDPQWLTDWSRQLQLFDELNPVYFGTCKTDLSLLALEQLTVLLKHNRCSSEICKIWSQRALRWSQNELWVTEFLAGLRVQFPTQQF